MLLIDVQKFNHFEKRFFQFTDIHQNNVYAAIRFNSLHPNESENIESSTYRVNGLIQSVVLEMHKHTRALSVM